MFGVGVDAGQTTIRLRHAWGQWKQIGAGQTNSPFMDVDVFPNILEYWGPNGMLFFRNVQVFWEPFNDGNSNARIAIERPGASGDAGVLADRVELQNVKAAFPVARLHRPLPRRRQNWGYVQLGGVAALDRLRRPAPERHVRPRAAASGAGASASARTSSSATNDVLRLQVVYGEGIENYFNDAPVDVGVKTQPRQPGHAGRRRGAADLRPRRLPRSQLERRSTSSAIGYSRVDIDNSDGQAPNAYKNGQYASAICSYTPAKNVMMGGEFQWAHRENNSDGFSVRRLPPAVLVQVQLLAQVRRSVMDQETLDSRSRCAGVVVVAAAGVSRSSARTAPGAIRRPRSTAPSTKYKDLKEGKNADYIPALAKVDPNLFGIALVTADGKVYTAGDIKTEVSIQSISKVFTMAQVIQEQGLDVDREADRRRRDRRAVQLDHRHRSGRRRSSAPARRR